MAWPFFEVNAVQGPSATSAPDTQQRSWSSQIAHGALDRRPGFFADGGDGRGDLGVHVHRDREPGTAPGNTLFDRWIEA